MHLVPPHMLKYLPDHHLFLCHNCYRYQIVFYFPVIYWKHPYFERQSLWRLLNTKDVQWLAHPRHCFLPHIKCQSFSDATLFHAKMKQPIMQHVPLAPLTESHSALLCAYRIVSFRDCLKYISYVSFLCIFR